MSHGGLIERHPLCTCPELTWNAFTGRADPLDLDACRSRAFVGIDPHPVLTDRDLRRIALAGGLSNG